MRVQRKEWVCGPRALIDLAGAGGVRNGELGLRYARVCGTLTRLVLLDLARQGVCSARARLRALWDVSRGL